MTAPLKIALVDTNATHVKWFTGLKAYLEEKGHPVDLFTDNRTSRYIFAAKRVVIWSGNSPKLKVLRKRCAARRIPVCFLEGGYFGKKETGFLSKNRSVGGDLFLGEDIPDLPDGGEEFIREEFRKYSKGASFPPRQFIAGFLQRPSDYAIRSHSRFTTMQQYVNEVEAMFPDDDVVFKVHPKEPHTKVQTRLPLYHGHSIWPHIMGAKQCVGINSTTLYEAAFAGVPVTALGKCPLRRHPDKHREIIHEILLRQLPNGSPDINSQVHKSVGDFFENK